MCYVSLLLGICIAFIPIPLMLLLHSTAVSLEFSVPKSDGAIAYFFCFDAYGSHLMGIQITEQK